MTNKIYHHSKLHNKAIRLEYATIIWNIFEGAVSIFLGVTTGSVALFAYGLESIIEVFASVVVIWDLKGVEKNTEAIALRMIGVMYLLASVYIFIEAIKNLLMHEIPEKGVLGIFFMGLTVFMMTWLGLSKRKVGREMQSATLLANAKFTLIDGLLSLSVLCGLVLHMAFGWWWADQIIALLLAIVAFREGIKEISAK